MESASMEGLLKAEEQKLYNELCADAQVDRDRRQSAERIRDAYRRLLLKYNAANAGDELRQRLADGMAGVALDEVDLLLASSAKKEQPKRPVRTGGIIGLLLAVIFCLAAALLIRYNYLAACVAVVFAAISAFLAGLLWKGSAAVTVRNELDADAIWRILLRTGGTMDRKIEEFCAQEKQLQEDAMPVSVENDEILMIGDLLEGLYSDSGDYALRQLKKLRGYLQRRGIELIDYTKDKAELFEVLPSKKGSMTLRPALLSGTKLLLAGRATEQAQ